MFKSIFRLIVLIVLFAACSDIERDNLLDPKNPDSFSETPILIEAFVNSSFSYDSTAIEALNQIENDYSGDISFEIVEYHRTHDSAPIGYDPYEQTVFTTLQDQYVGAYTESKAVPDIFVNGTQGRVRGASDDNSVYNRLAPIISGLSAQQSNYAIEVEIETSGQILDIDYRIARLGNKSEADVELNIIFVKNYGTNYYKRVAKGIRYPAKVLNKIESGEYSEGNINVDDYASVPYINLPDYAIFTITKQGSITVLKTLKKEILW